MINMSYNDNFSSNERQSEPNNDSNSDIINAEIDVIEG